MYHSIKEIIDICDEEDKEFWQVILESDVQERGVTETMSMDPAALFRQYFSQRSRK